MPKRKDPEAKIAELEAELKRKRALLSREKAKLAAQKRKDDTRRKIIAGALALEHAEIDPAWGATLWRVIDRAVHRDSDRALLGLPPRQANDTGEGAPPDTAGLRPPFSQAG